MASARSRRRRQQHNPLLSRSEQQPRLCSLAAYRSGGYARIAETSQRGYFHCSLLVTSGIAIVGRALVKRSRASEVAVDDVIVRSPMPSRTQRPSMRADIDKDSRSACECGTNERNPDIRFECIRAWKILCNLASCGSRGASAHSDSQACPWGGSKTSSPRVASTIAQMRSIGERAFFSRLTTSSLRPALASRIASSNSSSLFRK